MFAFNIMFLQTFSFLSRFPKHASPPLSKSSLATQVLETGQETNQQIMIIYLFYENAQVQVSESLT